MNELSAKRVPVGVSHLPTKLLYLDHVSPNIWYVCMHMKQIGPAETDHEMSIDNNKLYK